MKEYTQVFVLLTGSCSFYTSWSLETLLMIHQMEEL